MEKTLTFETAKIDTYTIKVNKVEYTVRPFLSSFDFVFLHKGSNSSAENCKRIAANLLCSKIDCEVDELPDFEKILQLPDEEYQRFWGKLFLNSNTLRENYQRNCAEQNMYVAFVNAMLDEEQIVAKSVHHAQKEIDVSIKRILDAYVDAMHQTTAVLSQMISDFSLRWQETVREVCIVSQEEQNTLINAYRQWGKYGWTIPENADARLFDDVPQNQVHADAIMQQFSGQEYLKDFWSTIKRYEKVNAHDLNEAVQCFRNECYKACCMILFSMIEGAILQIQMDYDALKLKDVKVGQGAIGYFKGKLNKANEKDKILLEILYTENITTCLFLMTQPFDKVSADSTIINRNLLMHGAMNRAVTEKDCRQLFFLYQNIMEQWDFLKPDGRE